jgi:dihydroxy-acid dehydratase
MKLRSRGWFGKTGKDGFIYRAWMKNQGIPPEQLGGKPVIGICNTWSNSLHVMRISENLQNLSKMVLFSGWLSRRISCNVFG